jgi:hypothetical protein
MTGSSGERRSGVTRQTGTKEMVADVRLGTLNLLVVVL